MEPLISVDMRWKLVLKLAFAALSIGRIFHLHLRSFNHTEVFKHMILKFYFI